MREPNLYKPEYCEAVIDHARKGGYLRSFGPLVAGVCFQTVYNWREAFPEFDEACKIAKGVALGLAEYRHWELAQEGENCRALEFRMRNLSDDSSRDTWRHVESKEISGPDGGAVPIQQVERVIVYPAKP